MKKILFMFVAALSMIASANAQTLSPKEIKKATKAAQKEVRAAKDQLADNGNINSARTIIDRCMKNEYVKDWAETWSVAADVYFKLYTDANIKSYQGTPYDTVGMYNYMIKWYDIVLTCDSLQQIPNEKGKTSTACRDTHGYEMYRNHTNFINAGIMYFNNRKDYKNAYEMFVKYYKYAETPILKSYLEQDTSFAKYAVEFAYFPTLAANNMGDYQKVLKYVDKAIEDPEYGPSCQRIKAEAYENMKDTANWISNLMTGIVNYPTDEYFYTKIIMYYNDTEKWEELENFVTDMIDKDPNKAYNYFVVGVLKQQQKDYETAAKNYEIAVEKDPELADAYINLGLCYMFLANEYVDANSNLNYRSAAYKKVLEVEKEYYQKALPMYEKVEKLLPNDVDKWGPQLYQIYYKLNMSKETSRMETILKAEGLL
ncbi:MAG: tetratricopeptide repeat protein [Bacteroidaceae bacterium]|nr:tetratricopeptide repeat protein [Bacteroidaceae bacterium]